MSNIASDVVSADGGPDIRSSRADRAGSSRPRRDALRRVVLYGAGMVVSAALLWIGFGIKGEPDVGTLLSGADALTLVGAHDKAIVNCLKVLERDPGNLRAHLLLALCYDRSGDADRAVASYRAVLSERTDPEMSPEQKQHVSLSIADLLRRHGKADEAIKECAKIEAEWGGADGRMYAVRGLAHAARGERSLAVADLGLAVAHSPADASFKDYLARVEKGETFASTQN